MEETVEKEGNGGYSGSATSIADNGVNINDNIDYRDNENNY